MNEFFADYDEVLFKKYIINNLGQITNKTEVFY